MSVGIWQVRGRCGHMYDKSRADVNACVDSRRVGVDDCMENIK